MSDIKIRPVKINLDKERNLIFDLNAFEELEEIYGNLDAAFKGFQNDDKKIKHIKNFLCAGLKHEDETLTPKSIGTMIDYNNLPIVTDQIWQAISQSLPDAKDGSEGTKGE